MARPVNLESDRLVIKMPPRQKRKVLERAEKMGMSVSEYVQALIDTQAGADACDIEFIRTLTAPLMDEFPQLSRLWLFGSRARGTATPDSDIDIAYELSSRPFSALSFCGTIARLERLSGYQIDDVNVTTPNDTEFYRSIERERILLHERS